MIDRSGFSSVSGRGDGGTSGFKRRGGCVKIGCTVGRLKQAVAAGGVTAASGEAKT